MARTTITQTALNYVTVSRDDEFTGERKTTTYFVPRTGGYVRIDDGRQFPQVCERLATRGSTLEATPDTLLAVIRREHRRGVEMARKDA